MPLAVPFPKLLLRKRLWVAACALVCVGGFYIYTRFDEVVPKPEVKGQIIHLIGLSVVVRG